MLSFTLGGLSKTVGLPQLKLAGASPGGRRTELDAALGALS